MPLWCNFPRWCDLALECVCVFCPLRSLCTAKQLRFRYACAQARCGATSEHPCLSPGTCHLCATPSTDTYFSTAVMSTTYQVRVVPSFTNHVTLLKCFGEKIDDSTPLFYLIHSFFARGSNFNLSLIQLVPYT